ncbi:MAG: sigma-70 family RNA polymerase sigma factor [Clostridia bacterium]|nr:sigma-70 family RNA polymerase sigma factor [Clostridia bacterium]
MIPDDALIAKARKGNVEAFEKLIQQYIPQVYNLAYRFMGNHEDAEDMAQEALIKAFRKFAQFRGECSFITWLYHIVSNTCRDELRRRTKVRLLPLEQPGKEGYALEAETEVASAQNPSPEAIYEKKELGQEIEDLICHLNPDYRLVLVMREFENLSYEEIAARLGCSMGTVKSRLSRARQILKDRILNLREQNQARFRPRGEGRVRGGLR